MEQITAVIITLNEERNIGRCIESLQGVADEVVVVDAGSVDRTEAICKEYGVRFERHDWQGYSAQKNYANSLARYPWLLSIDADEALSPQLRESLMELKQQGLERGKGYECCRLTCYCGGWVRHCGWYPDPCLRLWYGQNAYWEGEVHECLRFASPIEKVRIKGDLLHYSYYSIGEHAQKTVRYALLAGEKDYSGGCRCGSIAVWLKPLATFGRDYLLRGGWRDGHVGYTVCRMSAYYTFIKYARLRELTQSSTVAQ